MEQKKFEVIEEGRLNKTEMSALKGGFDDSLSKKCSATEMYMSCTCPKLQPRDFPFGNCKLLCQGQYITKPCGDENKYSCPGGYYRFDSPSEDLTNYI